MDSSSGSSSVCGVGKRRDCSVQHRERSRRRGTGDAGCQGRVDGRGDLDGGGQRDGGLVAVYSSSDVDIGTGSDGGVAGGSHSAHRHGWRRLFRVRNGREASAQRGHFSCDGRQDMWPFRTVNCVNAAGSDLRNQAQSHEEAGEETEDERGSTQGGRSSTTVGGNVGLRSRGRR